MILSDTGGVKEEAPALNKPVLVLRDTTERPEAVQTGAIKLVGTDPYTIEHALRKLVSDPIEYKKMAEAKNPYGDGQSAQRIVSAIKYYFDLSPCRPNAFV